MSIYTNIYDIEPHHLATWRRFLRTVDDANLGPLLELFFMLKEQLSTDENAWFFRSLELALQQDTTNRLVLEVEGQRRRRQTAPNPHLTDPLSRLNPEVELPTTTPVDPSQGHQMSRTKGTKKRAAKRRVN